MEIYGLLWKEKKYQKQRIDPRTIGIETNVLYKDLPFYYQDGVRIEKGGGSHYYISKDHESYRFYSENGNFYWKYIKMEEPIDTLFEPDYHQTGFISKVKGKYLNLTYSPHDGGRLTRTEIQVKGDTIVLTHKNLSHITTSYLVKQD